MSILKEDWTIRGSGEEDFIREVNGLAERTELLDVIPSNDIELFSLCKFNNEQLKNMRENGMIPIFRFTPETLSNFTEFGDRLQIAGLEKDRIGALYDELEDVGFLLKIKGTLCTISKDAIQGLCNLVMVSGAAITSTASMLKDLFLAEALFRRKSHAIFLTREENGVKKVFSVKGRERATMLPATNSMLKVIEVVNSLRKTKNIEFMGYSMSNTCIEAWYSTGEVRAGLKKGVVVRDSDTGNSALMIASVAFFDNDYAILDESSFMHFKEIPTESIEKAFTTQLMGSLFYPLADEVEQFSSTLCYEKDDIVTKLRRIGALRDSTIIEFANKYDGASEKELFYSLFELPSMYADVKDSAKPDLIRRNLKNLI